MSSTELNFKVILAAVHPSAMEAKDAIASLLASAFNTSVQQTRSFLEKLPVVLFENLTTNDVKAIKDHLIFFSKLGLDFNITPKAITNIPRANWTPKVALPVITCPSCGEMFYLMRSQDIQQKIHQNKTSGQQSIAGNKPTPPPPPTPPIVQEKIPNKQPSKTSAPPIPTKFTPPQKEKITKANDEDSVASEMEEIDVLSAELQSIVDMEEKPEKNDVEEIEEVGSISEELNEVGSVSEELRKISLEDENSRIPTVSKGIVSPQAPPVKITNLPELKAAPIQTKPSPTSKKSQDIEEIGGISAEFEEIEGVSAEFERICLEGMDGDIGSLSAEFEEIEGSVSSELEGIRNEEKISEIQQPMKNIASSVGSLVNDKKHGADRELEELQGISQELDEIADTSSIKKPNKPAVKPVESLKPVPKTMPMKATTPSETTRPLSAIKPTTLEPGNCKVIVNFTGKTTKEVIQLLAQVKNISQDQAKSLTESTAPIVAANGISLKSAQNILKQFQNLQVQGRISTI